MKSFTLTILVVLSVLGLISFTNNNAPAPTEFKVFTVVESIVPMGLGRSRIVENTEKIDIDAATTNRVNGKVSEQGNVKRKGLKIDSFKETKLLNFYSAVGINFQNIASNDAMIEAKINQLVNEGWELVNIMGGVESDSGDTDGKGIFITRYYFKRFANN